MVHMMVAALAGSNCNLMVHMIVHLWGGSKNSSWQQLLVEIAEMGRRGLSSRVFPEMDHSGCKMQILLFFLHLILRIYGAFTLNAKIYNADMDPLFGQNMK